VNLPTTTQISTEQAVQPMDLLYGLGSADRSLLAVSLALFDDSGLSKRLQAIADNISDAVKRQINSAEIEQTARSVESRMAFWHDCKLSDAELRLTLWIYLRDAFDLEPRLTRSTRGAEALACELTAAAVRAADPPNLIRTAKNLLDKVGWLKDDRRMLTLTDVVQPVLNELMAAALGEGAGQMDAAVQRKLIADARAKLEDLSETDQRQMLDAVGAQEMNDAAVRKILLTGGGLAAFSTSVSMAGFSAYILAAQASAFIPLVSGPALVSAVSVLSNPVTVIAVIAGVLWWVSKSTSQQVRTAVALRVVALLALQGLSAGRRGLEQALAAFASMSRLARLGDVVPTTFQAYRQEWISLTNKRNDAVPLDPAISDLMQPPAGQAGAHGDRLGRLLFPGPNEARITGATAALTLGDIAYSAAAIDPLVLKGADFARVEDLADPLAFAAFARQIESLAPAGTLGAVSNVKGYVAEQIVAAELVAHGYQVTFPDTSNQAGWDLLVDGLPFQVKCLDSASGLSKHFATYPDIPVFVNAELADSVPDEWKHHVFFVEDYSNELTSHITDFSMDAGGSILNPNVPLFALGVIAARHLIDYRAGRVSGRQAVEQILLDGSTRAGLAVAGGYAGAGIGLLVLGPAGALVLGSVVPLLSQAQSSRVQGLMDSHLKTAAYRQWEDKVHQAVDTLIDELTAAVKVKRTLLSNKYKKIQPGVIGVYVKSRMLDESRYLNECEVRLTALRRREADESVESRALKVIRFTATSTIHPGRYQLALKALRTELAKRPSVMTWFEPPRVFRGLRLLRG